METETSQSFIASMQHAWEAGGFWMYPIALSLVFAIAIAIDRIILLFFKSKVDKDEFVSQMTKHVLAGDLHGAVKFVSSQPPTALTNVVKAGLLRVNGSDQVVQSALDEASLRELPKIEKRTGYLAMIANLAMLLGLLGTISGLISCFAAVSKPGVDPALKSMILADGIAEAMNCTGFGLLAAIVALMFFAILNGRTQHMVDDIHETSVAVLNLIVNNRDKLKA